MYVHPVEKGADGFYSIYSPETETTVLNGQGESVDAAKTDLKESFKEVIDSYRERGDKLPEELKGEIDFVYKYDIASL